MRSDMFEVIIERPRWNGGRGSHGKGRRAEPRRQHDAPLWEPVSLGRGTKSLNENLAPLRRFLERRVGRPWDAVRGEICALITPRSAVQKHVLDHVKQMVEENAVLIDGRPHHPGGSLGHCQRSPILCRGWGGFYVCPRTGVLRVATERRPRPKREPDPDVKRVDDLHEARRIGGVWYLVTFAPVPATREARYGRRNVLLGMWVDAPGMHTPSGLLWKTYGRGDRYAAAKRQLSTREIRAHVG